MNFAECARLRLLEELKRRQHEQRALAQLAAASPQTASDTEANEATFVCLQHCLGQLTAERHALILRYYDATRHERIKHRQCLADELHIPLDALRKRAFRLRDKLENCIGKCLARKNVRDVFDISATDKNEDAN